MIPSLINFLNNTVVTFSEITSPSLNFIPISVITVNYLTWLL